LSLDIEKLTTFNGSWPKSNISISKLLSSEDESYRYISKSSYLKLDDISDFVNVFPELRKNLGLIEQKRIQGELTHALFIYDPSLPATQQYFIDTNVELTKISDSSDESVITGLSGHLQGNAKKGKFSITSSTLSIDLPKLFQHPLAFHETYGQIEWSNEDNQWKISTDHLQAYTFDFNANLKGEFIFDSGKQSPFVDIILSIKDTDIGDVHRYILLTLPKRAREWVKSSFISGEITSADIIFRGDLTDFPFMNNEGQFKILANIENATLDYHPAWVPIDSLDTEITINKNSLTVDARAGKIFNADIKKATATIKDLSADELFLEIDGIYTGTTNDGRLFIEQSPLVKNSALRLATQNDLNGDINIDMNMIIPLGSGSIKLDGKVTFHETSFYSPFTGIKLEKINGDVVFTEDYISAKNVKGEYFNNEVFLNIQSHDGGLPETSLSGYADKTFIISQLSYYFPEITPYISTLNDRISGTCKWQAELSFPDLNTDIKSKRKLKLSSTLHGLSLDFPKPLGKMNEVKTLEISTEISDAKDKLIHIKYGNTLDGIIEYDNTKKNLSTKVALRFGGPAAEDPVREGISIMGNIEQLTVSEWMELNEEVELNSKSLIPNINNVDINISSFEFIKQLFKNVNIKVSKPADNWLVDIHNNNDINGQIIIPENITNNPLYISFDNLILSEFSDADSDEYKLDPHNIPPLNIKINNFEYNNYRLGKLFMETSRISNGISIDQFNFSKPGLEINGKGTWRLVNNIDHSQFNIDLEATKLDMMLETFNYDVAAIKEGETKLKIDSYWEGPPNNFSFDILSGKINIEVNKGEFLDINPSAGRLFGLLSIQTLSRRLSLDFSDLFSEGLVFDQISGDFSLEKGNAYTNNLIMTGPSADIAITGRTGLSEKDYDQVVTVTPQVANSIPVASALFGPVGIGVGAVIFLAGEVFKSIPEQIDKLLRYQYTITGSWDDPVVEKFEKENETIDKNPLTNKQKT